MQQRQWYGMIYDTSTGTRTARGDRGKPLSELGTPLDELVCRGSRAILQRATEAEVEQRLETFARVAAGRAPRGVCDVDLPAGESLTSVSSVVMQVAKVRNRSVPLR